jgi:ribonuclease P protein component
MKNKKNTSVTRKKVDDMFKKSFIRFNNLLCWIRISKKNTEDPKLLIIIPKKVGNAPHRNYLRRISKELYRILNLDNNKKDIIVYFKPFKENTTSIFDELKKIFQSLFLKN